MCGFVVCRGSSSLPIVHLGAISLYKNKKRCLLSGLLIYKIQVGIKSPGENSRKYILISQRYKIHLSYIPTSCPKPRRQKRGTH
jgi:hypothetical protein